MGPEKGGGEEGREVMGQSLEVQNGGYSGIRIRTLHSLQGILGRGRGSSNLTGKGMERSYGSLGLSVVALLYP